jgi:hypothetical protein
MFKKPNISSEFEFCSSWAIKLSGLRTIKLGLRTYKKCYLNNRSYVKEAYYVPGFTEEERCRVYGIHNTEYSFKRNIVL